MPPSPNSLLCTIIIIFFFFISSLSVSLSSSSTINLSLTPFPPHHPSLTASTSASSWDLIAQLTAASLTRAHHLKRPKSNSSVLNAPLSPHSYGGYSIDLSFGTPPQKLTFVMDTGSSLVWFPCTSRYICSRCDFPNLDPSKIPTFLPKRSSSAKLLGCRNPKCSWISGPEVASRCSDCTRASQNCSQACPGYLIQYGSGNTGGVLLSETLDFSGSQTVPNFLIGCSVFSSRQPAGIAGFGRGPESLPAQMGLNKFSYCVLSRRFDDTAQTSNLVLETGSGSGDTKPDPISYTPFRKNPGTAGSAFKDYYYVGLRKIFVGGKDVKVPYKYLVPGENGDSGVIVDSGSTFTFMERPVFAAVAGAIDKYMVNVSRAKEVEAQSGLSPCYDVSGRKDMDLPELEFHFKGGAKMALPVENYFALFSSDVVCFTIVTDGVVGPEISGGPAIIVGSFQQQNYYVEYDLKNERFGYRKQNCNQSK